MEHQKICREEQELFVEALLKKYRGSLADEHLKEKIWKELSLEKHLGRLKLPFKVVLKRDPDSLFPASVEVLLESKI